MIFLDESGKRWKRIKHSTAGIVLVSALPVAALIGGSLAYHPQWGVLPLIQRAGGVVLTGATQLQPHTIFSVTSKPTAKPGAKSPQVLARNTTQSAAAIAGIVPTVTPVPGSPTPTPATPQATSQAGGNPTSNDFGQTHKPIR